MLTYNAMIVTMLMALTFDWSGEGNNAAWKCPCGGDPLPQLERHEITRETRNARVARKYIA